ncbi:MAG: hypothetical protein M1830_004372 [Pleopsidium flavum]|nr:MAG: hypothetical protein M1830_004372 [Pleopsidium flavum]
MSGNRADLEDYQVAKNRLKKRVAAALKRGLIPVDRPHCSLSISGHATLSLSEKYYTLTVTLHYHSDPLGNLQPVVVRTSRTALDLDTPLYNAEAYVMYTSPDLNYEDRLRHSIISICYRKIPGVSSKFSITPENGFIELAPGKTDQKGSETRALDVQEVFEARGEALSTLHWSRLSKRDPVLALWDFGGTNGPQTAQQTGNLT